MGIMKLSLVGAAIGSSAYSLNAPIPSAAVRTRGPQLVMSAKSDAQAAALAAALPESLELC